MSGAKPREQSDRRDLLWRTRNLLTRCNILSTRKKSYTHPRKATENSLVYPKSAPALLLVKTRNSLHVFPRSTPQRATGTFATLRMTHGLLVGRGCGSPRASTPTSGKCKHTSNTPTNQNLKLVIHNPPPALREPPFAQGGLVSGCRQIKI